jgi:hypothetical protein
MTKVEPGRLLRVLQDSIIQALRAVCSVTETISLEAAHPYSVRTKAGSVQTEISYRNVCVSMVLLTERCVCYYFLLKITHSYLNFGCPVWIRRHKNKGRPIRYGKLHLKPKCMSG